MKKTIILALAALMMTLSASAQTYTNSKYYNPQSGKLEYKRPGLSNIGSGNSYYGFRMGPAFSTIGSNDNAAKASSPRTGVNIGAVMGTQLTDETPLFLETGLFYIRKGGNAKYAGSDLHYSLDYLLLPIVFKYSFETDYDVDIQPFAGLYGALGVGGKVKDYTQLTADGRGQVGSAFENYYNRFDGGLRVGCGLSYAPFYVELSYDLGLINISKDDFFTSHTRSLELTLGVNF